MPDAAVHFAAQMFPYPEQGHRVYITAIVAATFAYGGVAAFGMPAFLLLRARKRTAFWIAPIRGFGAGFVTWLAFIVPFGLSLGNSWTFVSHDLATNSAHLWALLPAGASGATVGTTLWLIATPERND